MPTYSEELLSALLVTLPLPNVYPSSKHEVSAVLTGEKAIAAYVSTTEEFADDEYPTLVCSEPQLVVSMHAHNENNSEFSVYIHKVGEAWRIPALEFLTKLKWSGFKWSDAMEAFQSWLLGYNSEQIEAWISYLRASNVGWSGTTIYVIMSGDQRQRLSRLGWRCLDPGDVEAMVAFCAASDLVVSPSIAASRLPRNTAIARMGLSADAFRRVFGAFDHSKRVVLRTLDEICTIELNNGILSAFEFASEEGWK